MKTIMVRRMPDDLHHAFKIICATRNVSMNAMLIELIKTVVQAERTKGNLQ